MSIHFMQQRNNRIFVAFDGKIVVPYLETYFSYGCNLRCGFCGNMSPFSGGIEPKEKIIESMQNWSKRIRPDRFGISGGEPLLHPDFIELMHNRKSSITCTKAGIPNARCVPKC
jgi:organic radical activating enzyme